ncbi:hypothetical protein HYE82_03475 [Streptomyces sp. BR123]|uniref:hypothetical protein n=1 Tax=Streptomyces sp. BR123 TaxID=2749828 RepID=UPI0015C4562E|nr:hypothetical protein [Streptomyces sp. BR123]NXY93482.1 hypothetical protein [Streptomyces sp. BR123]
MADIELTDELIRLQQASDEAWAAVREAPSGEGWELWRERAAEVQTAVTEYAKAIDQPRNAVEAALKKRVRHAEPEA